MKAAAATMILALLAVAEPATADEIDLTPDYVPQERSDFERALESPPPQPYVPNALEALEQGQIPSYKNPMPPSEGFGATIGPDGSLQGTYSTTFK